MSKYKIIKFTIFFILIFFIALFVKNSVNDFQYNLAKKEVEKISVREENKSIDKEKVDKNKECKEDVKGDILPAWKILEDVPFSAQAPFGDWSDPMQQHGCEEASLVMAYYWQTGKELTLQTVLEEITAMSEYEIQKFGHYHDTSTADTLEIFKEYYDSENAFAKYDITLENIKEEIAKGNLVIVPTNGRKLGNPNYVSPGPLFHEIVIIGYDDETEEFITYDSGTRNGENYRYNYEVLFDAIRDYKTGIEEPVEEEIKAMIVFKK